VSPDIAHSVFRYSSVFLGRQGEESSTGFPPSKDIFSIPGILAAMVGETTTSINITQHISGADNICGGKDNYLLYAGGTGGRGGEGYDQGHGGSGGRGEGNTFNYNITAGQSNMNNQYVLQSPCINGSTLLIIY
jgi:hypothetical protein